MANGKRRANWEKVLEAKMQPVHTASMAMQAQIIDLQKEVEESKALLLRIGHCLFGLGVALIVVFAMVIAK